MPTVDAVGASAGSPVIIRSGGFFRPLAIALAAAGALIGAAPASAQIPIPIPNFRIEIHPGGGGGTYYHHHRGYTHQHVSRGVQKPSGNDSTGTVPNPAATTTPPTQTAGGQPSSGTGSSVPPPSATPPSGGPAGSTPAHSEARGGPDFEPSK